jgi:pyruvate,orthophosphate dikinase
MGPVLASYVKKDIYAVDPFVTIDRQGVGRLMRIAIQDGRATKPDLKLGICGEHGGDPNSVEFCDALGLDYVSCSPYRLPIARLAAAQAVLKQRRSEGVMAKKAGKKVAKKKTVKRKVVKKAAPKKVVKRKAPPRKKAGVTKAAPPPPGLPPMGAELDTAGMPRRSAVPSTPGMPR